MASAWAWTSCGPNLRCGKLGLPHPPMVCCATRVTARPSSTPGQRVIVKPIHEGSSIGMAKFENLRNGESLGRDAPAVRRCRPWSKQWIIRRGITVAILDGKALPAIRLRTPHTFYDTTASTDQRYQ